VSASYPVPEWLRVIQDRLHEVETERGSVAADIAQLESRAQLLNEEYVHLRAILEIPRAHETDSSGRAKRVERSIEGHLVIDNTDRLQPVATFSPDSAVRLEPEIAAPNLSTRWRDAVRDLLVEGQRPLHYRAIHQHLRRVGITFGGQNPAASFLAVLNRDADFERVGRGVYWVKGTPFAPAAERPRVARRRPRAKVVKRR
jgi:hypothetical protein